MAKHSKKPWLSKTKDIVFLIDQFWIYSKTRRFRYKHYGFGIGIV